MVVMFHLPEDRGDPMVRSEPMAGMCMCINDDSADYTGCDDERYRYRSTGYAMVSLDGRGPLEHEVRIEDMTLISR